MKTSFSIFSTKIAHTDMANKTLKYIILLQKHDFKYTHKIISISFLTNTYFTKIVISNFSTLVTYIMVKEIGQRYMKYEKRNNWTYPSPNSTFVIPNQSNITNTTQFSNTSGSPVSQRINIE